MRVERESRGVSRIAEPDLWQKPTNGVEKVNR